MSRPVLVANIYLWGWDIETPAPNVNLFFSVLNYGFLFVKSLQRTVHSLVQSPRFYDWYKFLLACSKTIFPVRIARFKTEVYMTSNL